MRAVSLAGFGIRAPEQQALDRYITEVVSLLSSEHASLPSRAHPVVDRILVSFLTTDPVADLEHRLSNDPLVLNSVRATLRRTQARLHHVTPLSSREVTDLATSLVMVRIFLSWRVGVLAGRDMESRMRLVASSGPGCERTAAHTWLWCGLVLSRLSGESDESDPDFGL